MSKVHITPHGLEGFLEDLMQDNDPYDLDKEDTQYIIDSAVFEGLDLPGQWATYKDRE